MKNPKWLTSELPKRLSLKPEVTELSWFGKIQFSAVEGKEQGNSRTKVNVMPDILKYMFETWVCILYKIISSTWNYLHFNRRKCLTLEKWIFNRISGDSCKSLGDLKSKSQCHNHLPIHSALLRSSVVCHGNHWQICNNRLHHMALHIRNHFIFYSFLWEFRDIQLYMGFPGGSGVQNLSAIAGHTGSIPGTGRSPGERNGKPRQYSCLENLKDRGARWVIVYGVAKSQTQLSN